ncbi:uncharacterized protein LOC131641299 [Vicia villosa]|uniref:uncharacterized protein LOC131641299 n=1 Tax=Vicia villosa TaxID=3911 RepID=UPI00273A89CE|nr:uncharacterized protein LOC131641299 [Vicia villosa]
MDNNKKMQEGKNSPLLDREISKRPLHIRVLELQGISRRSSKPPASSNRKIPQTAASDDEDKSPPRVPRHKSPVLSPVLEDAQPLATIIPTVPAEESHSNDESPPIHQDENMGENPQCSNSDNAAGQPTGSEDTISEQDATEETSKLPTPGPHETSTFGTIVTPGYPPRNNNQGYQQRPNNQGYQQQTFQPYTQPPPQQQGGPSKLEETMTHFMQMSMKNQKNQDAAIKNLETQVGQLAKQIAANQSNATFSANTQENPKEHCKAMVTRTGQKGSNEEVENNDVEKKDDNCAAEDEEIKLCRLFPK